MSRGRLRFLEVAVCRGWLSPEELGRVAVASPEAKKAADGEELWRALWQTVRIRPLPEEHCLFAEAAPASTTKEKLLARYLPALALRRRVREAFASVVSFWSRWVPEAADAFRPGASEAQLEAVERQLSCELPEDLAEWFRCHDGQTVAGWWFAEAEPHYPAVQVQRLLPLSVAVEALLERRPEGHAWLPLAQSRNGTQTWVWIGSRPREEGSPQRFGEVWRPEGLPLVRWPVAAHAGPVELPSVRQAVTCLEYLEDYAALLDGMPAQYHAKERAMGGDAMDFGTALRFLFASPRIDCHSSDAWATTILGKGKGNSFTRLSGRRQVSVHFPRLDGKAYAKRFVKGWY
eukprot:TRINITY_DN68893_c0_g1_i1.p1 TRINITY_DN68893_c0_g1~~TRINITY_DN68893_c0_g1_i1.p1  ORF type:complete len:347 (-),score=68.21 TRINITY_DN68893_c0_g1_i1:32-1072(-)